MKKIFFLFMLIPLIWSCSSDDNGNNDQKKELVDTKWAPEKVVPVIPLLGESEELTQYYPHQAGCDNDYLVFLVQDVMITYLHDASCNVSEQEQNWHKDGPTMTVEFMGYTISGEVSGTNSNQMIIESDISEYAELIGEIYPNVPIPAGSKIKLYLNKINN